MLEAPRELPPLPSVVAKGRIPSLQALGLEQEVVEPPPGGESEGRRLAARFLRSAVRDYGQNHDA